MNEARGESPKNLPSNPCKKGQNNLRIFSWNVNGLRAVLRKGALQKFLEDYEPDILCLQEIKCKPDQLSAADLDALNKDYQGFWSPAARPGYSGTAILVSRRLGTKIIDKKISIEHLETEGRLVALELPDFYLVNVYTPNAKPDLSRLSLRHDAWDPAFRKLLKSLEESKPVVTCGDFNCAHAEIDLARPKTNHHNAGFTDEEREGVTNLIDSGFVDTFRAKHPNVQRYTWWSHWGNARANNVGWRIDYFFISKSLKLSLEDAEIYESVLGSDHCPISITIKTGESHA